MTTFIRKREVKTHTTYELVFNRTTNDGSGYGFPCDKNGQVYLAGMTPEARATLEECLRNLQGEFYSGKVKAYSRRYVDVAVIRCRCGAQHPLFDHNGMGDSQCDCGQWYNACGQQLSPPDQWGEETGERFNDDGMQS